uniref:C-type lectin domain-containing protein n=1 Tax=Poecilia formosa TaxID=48698 RepID=A0A096LUV0_POEFO
MLTFPLVLISTQTTVIMQWYLFFLTVMVQNHLMDCQLYQYHYVNEEKTWTEAQQYCREKHTDLVTVTNMKDMKRLINISAGDQSEAWIGLYDQTNTQRSWHWSLPGVEFNESEKNWATGEPNGDQSCAIIWKDGSNFLKWGDLSCNEKQNFLCYNGEKILICFNLDPHNNVYFKTFI